MNWIILVIKGKENNKYYLSSGERKDKNKVKKNNKIVGKQYNSCDSQII